MADAQLIVAARRMRSDLLEFKRNLRQSYPKPSQQVTSGELKRRIAALAEIWFARLSQRPEIVACVSPDYTGDLNIHFQHLLVCADRASVRRRYDHEIAGILRDYTTEVLVPLMQGTARTIPRPGTGHSETFDAADAEPGSEESFRATAFVGHSFSAEDKPIAQSLIGVLEALGIRVVTGERPKAARVSEKVKRLIDGQHLFVGIFTRRDRLVGKSAWSTSPWVIDEKAYATARKKKLILLKEEDVDSIGGIQGDYEFIEFRREQLHEVIPKLLQLFILTVQGLHG